MVCVFDGVATLFLWYLEHADPKSLFTLVASGKLITAFSSCVMLNKSCCDAGGSSLHAAASSVREPSGRPWQECRT